MLPGLSPRLELLKKETPLFYVPPEMLEDPAHVTLPPDEAVHAARVLRRRVGDEVQVIDGEGNWYRVRLSRVSKDEVSGIALERRLELNEPAVSLRIGVPLLKSKQRFETFLEKAVELGVTEVIPLTTERTKGRKIRMDRARQILISAMKQCRRCRLPVLREPQPLSQVLFQSGEGMNCIAHEGASTPLLKAISSHEWDDACILIGPEGGFAEEEIRYAEDCGYTVVSMGRRRLRSETAAIAAASTVAMHCLSVGAVLKNQWIKPVVPIEAFYSPL